MHAVRAIATSRIRRFQRVEYERLVEAGMFEREKVDLLYGQIVEMSAHGRRHAYAVEHLCMDLVPQLSGRASVRIQLPFAALDDSEPEPDVAIVAIGASDTGHPTAASLIIEVADSSLADDRDKRSIYAAAGVPEYWVVNLVDDVVERYTSIAGHDDALVERSDRNESICLPSFPDVLVKISSIVPLR